MTVTKEPRTTALQERIVRTLRTAGAAHAQPYLTHAREATPTGNLLKRTPAGWADTAGVTRAAEGLTYPLYVVRPAKGYHQSRAERRATDRAATRWAVAEASTPATTTARPLTPAALRADA